MAKKYICDRCGEDVEGEVKRHKIVDDGYWVNPSTIYEFCEDCEEKFQNFLDGEEKKQEV